jgi:hypothetical protein
MQIKMGEKVVGRAKNSKLKKQNKKQTQAYAHICNTMYKKIKRDSTHMTRPVFLNLQSHNLQKLLFTIKRHVKRF